MGGNLIDYLNILIEEALIQSPALLTYDEADNYKARFKALFDQQKQELLDALTIEKRTCLGYEPGLCESCANREDTKAWNAACDELEVRKQKIRDNHG